MKTVCEVWEEGRVTVRLSPTQEGTMEYFGNGRDEEVSGGGGVRVEVANLFSIAAIKIL